MRKLSIWRVLRDYYHMLLTLQTIGLAWQDFSDNTYIL